MVVMAPKDENELRHMLQTAIAHEGGPVAIRYPRGCGVGAGLDGEPEILPIGKAEILLEGRDAYVLAIGSMVVPALEAARMLNRDGYAVGVVNMRFVKPLDAVCLEGICRGTRNIITVEENTLQGGFGSAVMEHCLEAGFHDVRIRRIGLPDRFVEHGKRPFLLNILGLDQEGILRVLKEEVKR
jgi:1-deoxy-D-xylulose-5-phosphate synthase